MVALLAGPVPAFASGSGSTPVTVQIAAGTLDITVPTSSVNLGLVNVSGSPQTVSSQLGTISVTDGRGGTAGWTVSANAVDFTGPQNISVSAPGSSSYSSPNASVTGTATVTKSDLAPLYPPGPVQVATGVSGINSATWNPTISVTLPANALAGTYSSTVTHSVS
ncbi:hypothetical protein GCM10009665_33510 [Kitasatospora nipponensis]|uniref:WxL domain-containing protein n=1 Tax=Kitasatospora nipponensis TaxID=258049 RepID=A0ABN1WAE4_9ACTN